MDAESNETLQVVILAGDGIPLEIRREVDGLGVLPPTELQFIAASEMTKVAFPAVA